MKATRGRVIASFPTFSVIRSPQRKIRYALLHRCPVYVYTPRDLGKMLECMVLGDAGIVWLGGGPCSDVLADVRLK